MKNNNTGNKMLLFEQFQLDTQNDETNTEILCFENFCSTLVEQKNSTDKCPTKVSDNLSITDKQPLDKLDDSTDKVHTFAQFIGEAKKVKKKKVKDEGDSDSDDDKKREDCPKMTPAPDPSECIPLAQISVPTSSLTL